MLPWKKTAEFPIAEPKRRKVIGRTFLLPDGSEQTYEVKQEGNVVVTLALTKERQVILARQFRVGPERYFEEMPGGGMEKGETPEVAGARELLEETGYAGDVTWVGGFSSCGYSMGLRNICVAVNCERVAEQSLDEGELVEIVLVELAAFRELVRAGQLTDGFAAYRGLDYLRLL